MDHLATAEGCLRDAGHEAFADAIRDDYLPRGVLGDGEGDGRWSYDVLETYEETFLEDVLAFEDEVAEDLADGRRHVEERRQERDWTERARD
ncbi:hypothetical protein GCM10009037_00970 [Halarchaeum grantii]|uniref:Uncharacterized protein n=2 Tax=Halarchaeum grantii TaxID=1193105 RepID=A0A830EXX8_9EURY|nr:hypothetical protein GCM10009037_00970 [Halarchaeum grantii]